MADLFRHELQRPRVKATPESAGALYTNHNKAELTIVVTVVICRPAHKHTRMERPLVGRLARWSVVDCRSNRTVVTRRG